MEYNDFCRELDTYVDTLLYPAIAENLSGLFPSLNFRRRGAYWVSDTALSGTSYRGEDILYSKYEGGYLTIGANNPDKAGIAQYAKAGGRGVDVITLYRALNGNITYTEAVKKIAEEIGVSLDSYPKGGGYTYDIQPAEDKDTAKEAFTAALWASTEEAKAARDFLRKVKGYSDTEIKEAGIGLATPEVLATLERTAPKWYPRTDKEGKALPTAEAQGIGRTWKIAVPMYYGSKVDSFNFRTVGTVPGYEKNKYRVPSGLRRDIFSGLTTVAKESLILVEGELDALKARLAGIPNVVSYGMNYVGLEKVKNAVKRGLTKFTIVPDNDTKEGVAATDQAGVKNIVQSIANLYEGGATEVYVATLPIVVNEATGKAVKDTEEYIATFGPEAWKKSVGEAKAPAVAYLVNRSFTRFAEKGNYTAEDRAALLTELEGILTAPQYDKYSQREEAYSIVKAWLTVPGNSEYFKITVEGLREYVEGKRDREAEALRKLTFSNDIQRAADLSKAGAQEEAAKILTASLKKNIGGNTEATAAAIFRHPDTAVEVEAEISKLPEGIRTGLYLRTTDNEAQELTLKEGVSLLVGARKHGKTTILSNIALREAAENIRRYKAGIDSQLQKVVFISYEVTYARLVQKLLSIYLNNPEIGKNSARSILSYYKGAGASYFRGGEEGEGYRDFMARKDSFYTDYINSGALTLVTADKVQEITGTKLTVEKLVSYTDTFLRDNRVTLVALDYIQEITSEARAKDTRVEELKYIGEVLRDFANPRKLAILCAAQFNRQIVSLIDLLTTNIGEAGDLERNGVDIIGLFNLKELKRLRGGRATVAEDIAENVDRLKPFGVDPIREYEIGEDSAVNLAPVPGKLFITLMASRFDNFPADVVTDFVEGTGYVDIEGTKAIVEKATTAIFTEEVGSDTRKALKDLKKEEAEANKALRRATKAYEKANTAAEEANAEALEAEKNYNVAKAAAFGYTGKEVKALREIAEAKRTKAEGLKDSADRLRKAEAEAGAKVQSIAARKIALAEGKPASAPAPAGRNSRDSGIDYEDTDTEEEYDTEE